MTQWKLVVAVGLPAGILGVGVHLACATGPDDATQSALAGKATIAPAVCIIAVLGGKERVYWMPLDTGKERVIDAVVWVHDLLVKGHKDHMWILRRDAHAGVRSQVLPVDWGAIVRRGNLETDYVLQPGDTLYAK